MIDNLYVCRSRQKGENMLCNEQSSYPDKIDEMTFFQDVSLNTIEYMIEYQTLLSKGRYTDANKYINNQTGIYGCFACFFNMLENRIYALQNYLLNRRENSHEVLSKYIHEELSEHTHKELTKITGDKMKFNPVTNQSEIPEHAVAYTTVWTGGKYTN